MDLQLQIKPPPGLEAALQRLEKAPAALLQTLAREMAAENELTVAHIQSTKLRGRGKHSLGVVTRRLSRSVTATRPAISGSRVTSTIGTNVEYAAAHEFGFKGTVTVRAHRRKLPPTAFGGRVRNTQEAVTVRRHRRNVSIPERAMFRTGLQEREADYQAAIARAVSITLRPPSDT